jgi:hypothetical protein
VAPGFFQFTAYLNVVCIAKISGIISRERILKKDLKGAYGLTNR